jgi:hypothetical protein
MFNIEIISCFQNHFHVTLFSYYARGSNSLYSGAHHDDISNSVPVWGAISGGSLNNVLKKLDGRLDSRQYIECLNRSLLPEQIPCSRLLSSAHCTISKSVFEIKCYCVTRLAKKVRRYRVIRNIVVGYY